MKLKSAQILKNLHNFNKDSDWISDNLDELRKEYADQYIAVRDSKVIDHDAELHKLLQRLREKNIDPGEIPVDFISKEPKRLII